MTFSPGLGVATLGRALLGVEGLPVSTGSFSMVAEADFVVEGFPVKLGFFGLESEADFDWESPSKLFAMHAEATLGFKGAYGGRFATQANALVNYFWVPELCPGESLVDCEPQPAEVSFVDQLAEVSGSQGVGSAHGDTLSAVVTFCPRRRKDC